MLYLVGLGLGDAKDITVKGLEIIKKADKVFLEAYTSVLSVGKDVLVRTISRQLRLVSVDCILHVHVIVCMHTPSLTRAHKLYTS